MARPRIKVSVLMYHDIVNPGEEDSSGFPGPAPARYKLDWDSFRTHLDVIRRVTGSDPVVLHEALSGAHSSRSWALTFDDGGSSAVEVGEELARRGWRGHFFVVSDLIGARSFSSRDGVVSLERMGHIVGSHSRSHPSRMTSRSTPELLDEWRDSLAVLSEMLGHPVDTASVPGGSYSTRVARAAATAGVSILCTSEPSRAIGRIDGCALVGRGAIRRHVRPSTAADLAAGRPLPWMAGRVAWNARKLAKAVSGRSYERARAAWLARGS
jgi:peptidoglycan/xylan/chitin deacetylase (PgdA/CDA1 family)